MWLALLIAIAVGWSCDRFVGRPTPAAGAQGAECFGAHRGGSGGFPDHHLGRLPVLLGRLVHGDRRLDWLGAVVLTRASGVSSVPGGGGPSAPPPQSLEELDAEVLAPLALPVVVLFPSCPI